MSPDLAFILTLSLRMAVTAAFVLVAALVTERSGPAIGSAAKLAYIPIVITPHLRLPSIDQKSTRAGSIGAPPASS